VAAAEVKERGNEEIAQMCERTRAAAATAKLTPEQRFGCEVAELCSKGVGHQWFMKGLKEVGVSLEVCFAQLKAQNKEKGFFRGMPSINVFLTLTATSHHPGVVTLGLSLDCRSEPI
jgi:hypothetical protein